MSIWRRGARKLGFLSGALFATVSISAAQGETVKINLDQAHVMRLPDRVSTIVIGNPLIADATLQAGGMLVVTGKGYGATNLLALDRSGRVVMDNVVQVAGPGRSDVIVMYKGVNRESYSCAPECLPRITLGDSNDFFAATVGQTAARNGQAQGSK
ncbi:MAG: pilus assembly protein N-terminal domain-containing protein [Pseudolabrys sp.]